MGRQLNKNEAWAILNRNGEALFFTVSARRKTAVKRFLDGAVGSKDDHERTIKWRRYKRKGFRPSIVRIVPLDE